MSLMSLSLVGAAAVYATTAFFSDTETSNNNILGAESLDLQVAKFTGMSEDVEPLEIYGPFENLNGSVVFDVSQLKPGDEGDVKLKFKSTQNSWLCGKSHNNQYQENGRTSTEIAAGDTTNGAGELQNYLTFRFPNSSYNGVYTLSMLNDLWLGIQDSSADDFNLGLGNSMVANAEYEWEMEYCFGTFVDGTTGACNPNTTPGFYDDSQTDKVLGSLSFQAVQSDNNPGFSCSSLNPAP